MGRVTALHNHMLDEQPRLFFLHFWGRGLEAQLGRALRIALDATNHKTRLRKSADGAL